MLTEAQRWARMLTVIADDLEQRGYFAAGGVHQAATFLALLETHTPAAAEINSCARCGGKLAPQSTGRPRRYCLDCSPRKTPEKSKLRS